VTRESKLIGYLYYAGVKASGLRRGRRSSAITSQMKKQTMAFPGARTPSHLGELPSKQSIMCSTQSYTVQTNFYWIVIATRMKGDWVLTCIYPEDRRVLTVSLV
jgi:hypothetical protein